MEVEHGIRSTYPSELGPALAPVCGVIDALSQVGISRARQPGFGRTQERCASRQHLAGEMDLCPACSPIVGSEEAADALPGPAALRIHHVEAPEEHSGLSRGPRHLPGSGRRACARY